MRQRFNLCIMPIAALVIATLVFVTGGCDPDYVGGAGSADVVGHVSLDGDPIEGAHVIFIPLRYTNYTQPGFAQLYVKEEQTGMSFGVTDSDGKFELKKANGDSGATLGWHRVIISKRKSSSGLRFNTDLNQTSVSSAVEVAGNVLGVRVQPSGELIPALYNVRSILRTKVDSSLGTVRPEFELTTIDPMLLEEAPVAEIPQE